MDAQDIFSSGSVRSLFDEMAASYGVVNLLSSFGLSWWWRRQVLRRVTIHDGARVADLMSGMGELWPALLRRIGRGRLVAIDISSSMSRRAQRRWARRSRAIEFHVTDVLRAPLEPGSLDVVVSSFGLKTFNAAQLDRLAQLIARALCPGGQFSLIEISLPPNRWLRALYLFHLDRVIPLLGRLFLGNPANYRMLGVYTREFESARLVEEKLRARGLEVSYQSHFFGCATSVAGRKPAPKAGGAPALGPALPHSG
jgi:demethylmenaquinone methyltransferase/2-methoxy-6-polyprenyl-1,4-benzoquinol methylase